MRDFYAQFDVNWLNQETLVNDAFEPSGYPLFSTPGDITDALYDIGFRVFSLSNNHSYDKGAEGIASSLEHWASMPKDVVSEGFYDPGHLRQLRLSGRQRGHLRLSSYTQYTNGIPTPTASDYGVVYLDDRATIEKQIADVRPNCDVLVVSCHWGVEGSHVVDDFQKETAQWLADQGVDLIIGTHPHVTQTAQWLTGAGGNQTFVAYSLGNFLNAQSQPDMMVGAVLDITFQKTTAPGRRHHRGNAGPQAARRRDPVRSRVPEHPGLPLCGLHRRTGAAHGNFSLTRAQIEEILRGSIDEAFLTLE